MKTRKPKRRDDDFDVVTWNAHRNGRNVITPHIKKMLADGVTVFEVQELKEDNGGVDAFRDCGLAIRYNAPEFAVAWSTKRWDLKSWEPLVLSDKDYWKDQNEAIRVVLTDNLNGQECEFISAHPPAHVQAKGHKTWKKVMAVLRDAAKNWRGIAKNAWVRLKRVIVIGMDGNVDHTKGFRPKGGWGFMHAGPLKLIMPKKGTHHSRIIDYFLVIGVKRVGDGELYDVDSDHLAYRQTMRYRWRSIKRLKKGKK